MIILASKSPRRAELMKIITQDYIVVGTEADESFPFGTEPGDAVCRISRAKAAAACVLHPDKLVVAADTIVVINGETLGKPSGPGDAALMLRKLSGKQHEVYTGVTLLKGLGRREFFCRTLVRFYPLIESVIEWYVSTGEPMDKAGAYGIQGCGALLVEGIDGDFYNVMGLPVSRLYREIAENFREELTRY